MNIALRNAKSPKRGHEPYVFPFFPLQIGGVQRKGRRKKALVRMKEPLFLTFRATIPLPASEAAHR